MSAGRPIVDGAWLEAHLHDPDLVVVEVDERPRVYGLGHVPGAHCLDWRTDLQDAVTRDIPSREAIATLWGRLGVTRRATVVFYGDKSNWYACFGYWLFHLYGARTLRLLDGGRQTWLAEDRPLSLDAPPPAEANETLRPRMTPRVRASWRDVQAAMADGTQLVDVRTPAEYRGAVFTEAGYPEEGARRAGHIPGALSVPWDLAVDLDGRVRGADELREVLGGAGIDLGAPVITYCRIGERSAHTWFVLQELLGVRAANYDGSWTEWGSMIGMPVAVGDEPDRDPTTAAVRDGAGAMDQASSR